MDHCLFKLLCVRFCRSARFHVDVWFAWVERPVVHSLLLPLTVGRSWFSVFSPVVRCSTRTMEWNGTRSMQWRGCKGEAFSSSYYHREEWLILTSSDLSLWLIIAACLFSPSATCHRWTRDIHQWGNGTGPLFHLNPSGALPKAWHIRRLQIAARGRHILWPGGVVVGSEISRIRSTGRRMLEGEPDGSVGWLPASCICLRPMQITVNCITYSWRMWWLYFYLLKCDWICSTATGSIIISYCFGLGCGVENCHYMPILVF